MRCALALVALAAAPTAQCGTEKLLPTAAADFDLFGARVAIDGETIVAAIPEADDKGFGSGAVDVFERVAGAWVPSARLVPADGLSGDSFSDGIALSGERIAVGAPGVDTPIVGAGAVYVLDRVGGIWSETAKLVHTAPGGFDLLGYSVGLSGDTLVAGAYGADLVAQDAGAAYVFELVGGVWTETATLLASDAAASEAFGHEVTIDGDTILVATNPLGLTAPAQKVYVFERVAGVWTETAQLQPAGVQHSDEFARRLDVSGDTIVVSAHNEDDLGTNSGAAFVYERVGGVWTETARLLASDGVLLANFGWAVAVNANRIVVGAFNAQVGGAVYWFEQSGSAWIEREIHVPTGIVALDGYGIAVDASATDFVGGAAADDQLGDTAGAAYTRAFLPALCTLAAAPDSISLSAGGQQSLSLAPGAAHAGAFYWLAGTASGIQPGFAYGAWNVPLNPDAWFRASVLTPNLGPFQTTAGFLDAAGRGTAAIVVAPGSQPAMAGLTLHHAFAIVDLGTQTIVHVSNAEALALAP